MQPPITNVTISSLSYDGSKAALGWHRGEFCYHLWFRPEERTRLGVFLGDGTVYKNPIEGTAVPSRRDPTIRMSAASGPNMMMLEKAWQIADQNDLLKKAITAEAEKQELELRAREAAILLRRREAAAEELYHALVYARNLIGPDEIVDAAIAKAESPVLEED